MSTKLKIGIGSAFLVAVVAFCLLVAIPAITNLDSGDDSSDGLATLQVSDVSSDAASSDREAASSSLAAKSAGSESGSSKSSTKIAKFKNEKIKSLIVAEDANGDSIDPATIDEDSYDGFSFTLKDGASKSYHSKEFLSQFDGRITYLKASKLYVAKDLDAIEEFAEKANIDDIDYIEPDYYMTVAGTEEEDSDDDSSLVDDAVIDLGNSSGASNGTDSSEAANSGSGSEGSASAAVSGTSSDASASVLGASTPNDYFYSSGQWNLRLMNVPTAWDRGLYGKKSDGSGDRIKVAIIDSGIVGTGSTSEGTQSKHEDLDYSHILTGINLVTSDTETGTPDTLGHGTAVAGIIAAQRNNNKGIAGIAPDVDILPIKVFEGEQTLASKVIEGIERAAQEDVDIINLSLGSESNVRGLEAACEDAISSGCIIVAAAGNDGKSDPNYPAAYDSVISVASINSSKVYSSFSQYGNTIDVAAPGELVYSLGIKSSSSYSKWSGTSFATPEVVALAAIARSVDSDMTQSEFKTLLQGTSVDLGESGYDVHYGWGLVDFGNVLTKLLGEDGSSGGSGSDTGSTSGSGTDSGSSSGSGTGSDSGSAGGSSSGDTGSGGNSGSGSGGNSGSGGSTPTTTTSLSGAKLVISAGSYYTGKPQTPSVKVTLNGTPLDKGIDYKVTYFNNTYVGQAALVVSGIGSYTGAVSKTFIVYPKPVSGIKLSKGKKQFTAKWTKSTAQTSGFQVRYSTKSNMKSAKTVKVSGSSAKSKTIKKLKKKKTYYVQVRSYKIIGKTIYYSYWSSAKKVKTK